MDRRAFLKRSGVTIAGAGMLDVLLAACGGGQTGGGQGGRVRGGGLVIAFPNNEQGDEKGLDPGLSGATTFTHSINGAMFDQLVYQDPRTQKIVGGLAQSWDVSGDGRQYTFHLKPHAKFWDGSPVTAEDVQFTMDRNTDPADVQHTAYNRGLAQQYDHTEVVGPTTVRIHLKEPQANFLSSALGRDYFGVVPKAYVQRVGPDAFNGKPMGSGPFQFVDWAHGDHTTVKRNPDYKWGAGFFHTSGSAPSVEKITFRFIEEDATRLAALQSGQVNAIIGIPAYNRSQLETDSRYQITKVRKNGQPAGIDLQTQRFPTNDLAVRRAITYAIDRDAINKTVYAGTNYPAYHILEDRMGRWVNPKAAYPHHDPARAKQLLDAAGWRVGASGTRTRDGRSLVLDAYALQTEVQVLTLIQAQLKRVGIRVNINPVSLSSIGNLTASPAGAYNIVWSSTAVAGWTNEDPNILYNIYYSGHIPPGGTQNYSHTKLPDVDTLLAEGATALDPSKRQSLYHQAQEKLVSHVPYVPLISFNEDVATVKGVNGLMPDVRGTYTYFSDVWIDKSIQSKWQA